MVIPKSVDEETTYREMYNYLMFERDKDRFEEMIDSDLDAVAGTCLCPYDEADVVRFSNDKTYIFYCRECGGIGSGSLRGNHY